MTLDVEKSHCVTLEVSLSILDETGSGVHMTECRLGAAIEQ